MKDLIVPFYLDVVILGSPDVESHTVSAKVDSGADNCSLDIRLAQKLGLAEAEEVVAEADIINANGVDKRPVVEIEFELEGIKIKTLATIADRTNLDCPFLIGRSALKNDEVRFLIDPLKRASSNLKKLAKNIRLNYNEI